MNRKPFASYKALAATVLGLLAAQGAVAQAPVGPPATTTNFPGDWPTLGAFNNRQGQNGDPLTYNSGLTNLRWTTPATVPETLNLLLDDTDITPNFYTNGGPYDAPLGNAGYVQYNGANSDAGWNAPAATTKEAGSPYVPLARLTNVDGTPALDTQLNRQPRTPPYHYAFCVPSAHGTDPTVPLAAYAGQLRTVDYVFTPPAGASRNYEVYAYLPIGSTDTSPGATAVAAARLFPQQYYVYQITYSNGLKYTDVVDTYQAGQGFIRLGNSGLATNRIFPATTQNNSTAIYPIRVRLFNTVPRYSGGPLAGALALPGAYVNEPDGLENQQAQTRLVYADACEARPTLGNYTASPSTATVTAGTTLDQFDTTTNPYTLLQASTIDWRLTVARNDYLTSVTNGALDQTTNGTVISYQANPNLWKVATTPLEAWRYSTVADANGGTTVDDGAASVTSVAPWASETTPANPNHIGTTYLISPAVFPSGPPIVRPPDTSISAVTYAPTLADGTYGIYAYIPGNGGGEAYAHQVEYQIYQGATLVDTVYVDQSTPQGWLQIGSTRYQNVQDTTTNPNVAPLSVRVTNYDNSLADSTNAALKVYADAIRFVGSTNRSVNSSPVNATVNITSPAGTAVPTKVTIVADESGKIHCLDLLGNGDGTTTEYWSYPSTSDGTTGYSDPNAPLNGSGPDGSNGVILATMPTGFDLSTAAVAHVGAKDLLYIGATNGRVYCIDMAGRGDFVAASRRVGSTQREWTYPNDYDPSNPTGPVSGTSALGAFRGSIVVGDATQGLATPTIFVGATQGRVYALDAAGSETTRSTTVDWQFPLATQSQLPGIQMTPTLFKPSTAAARLYFGTLRNSASDGPGQLYALDAASGSVVWQYNGSPTLPNNRVDATMSSYVTGMVAVTASALDAVPASVQTTGTVTHVDTLYALNNNLRLYGFNAATGDLITYNGIPYSSTDLDTLSTGNLSYTVVQAYNRLRPSAQEQFPVIVVPGSTGLFEWAFARPEDYNQFNGYLAGGFSSDSITNFAYASPAASNNYLFAADGEGKLFALDTFGAAAGNLSTDPLFDPGIQPIIPPNDPRGDVYRHLKVKLVNKAAYAKLREATSDPGGQGPLTYDQAVNDPQWNGPNGPPYAFEWGETAYVLVYNFPYTIQRTNGNQTQNIPPPTISLNLSVDGKSVRNVQVDSRKFVPTSPPVDGDPAGTPADGYAVVPFAFQNAGATALPPGQGRITASLSTAVFGTGATTQPQLVTQDTRSGSTSEIDFTMANPLAVRVYDTPTATGTSSGIGDTLYAADPQNSVNGSPNIGTTNYSQLLASAGIAQNGTTATARLVVEDRSLMVILRPEGLTNVRLARTNLQREGGEPGIIDPLPTVVYPGFEDKPVNFPNTSLDYPDIGREQVRAVKDPNGSSENPLLTTVTLNPPHSAQPGASNKVLTEDDLFTQGGQANMRIIEPTNFALPIDVPRYQPPVAAYAQLLKPANNGLTEPDDNTDLTHLHHNLGATLLDNGYFGRVQVFVDTNGNGQIDLGTSAEPYRGANYTVGVQSQTSILVGTPTLDLGSLAEGTGYAPAVPGLQDIQSGLFSPWNPSPAAWANAYQPISVRNDSNVNLLRLRLARATNPYGTDTPADNTPWPLNAADNDPLAWLSAILVNDNSGTLDATDGALWSNFGAHFAARHGSDTTNAIGAQDVILPKPRVTDRTPSELVANPYPRANPNIRIDPTTHQISSTGVLVDGTARFKLDGTLPTSAPKVAVAVPIGFPVGSYKSQIQVVENSDNRLGGLDNEILEFLGGTITPVGALNPPPSNQFEAYSDPITLTFKVRESRLTNAPTPRTATMIDAGTGNGPTTFANTAPAAMRTATGSLAVAWQSDRAVNGGTSKVNGTSPSLLYFAGLNNKAGFTSSGINAPAGNAPLWDLTQFDKTNASWFQGTGAGYPTNGDALFLSSTAAAGTGVKGTSFRDPSFPARGQVDPFSTRSTTPTTFSTSYVGFVGDALVSTPSGTLAESRVFVAPVGTNGATVTPGTPSGAGGDLQTTKGKPSVLQLSNSGGLVFYAETGSGQSGITVSPFSTSGATGNAVTFANPVPLYFGDGFSSVFSPSANGRVYLGVNAPSGGQPIVELSFAGKLRGRANAEPFMGRLRLDGNGNLVDSSGKSVETQGAGSPFIALPVQSFERLSAAGDGLYRARGVAWNRADLLSRIQNPTALAPTPLVQFVGTSSTPVDLLVPGTATVDRQSGIIAVDSRAGGKVYFDPDLGTVRLAGGVLNRNSVLRLTYVPTFLRVTNGGSAGYSAVNAMFDDRYVGEYSVDGNNSVYYPYWFEDSNNLARPADNARNDRFLFAYGRGSTGSVTARPYTTTMRLGVRLPGRIYTDSAGGIGQGVNGLQVTGNTRPYQVDPANGRVYFQAEDEDRPVQITYNPANEATGGFLPRVTVPGTVSFVLERDETPIPVDEAANESALTAFLDPFTYPSQANVRHERPPLVWLFYTSTRAGAPDVYFQTIAPRYLPSAK